MSAIRGIPKNNAQRTQRKDPLYKNSAPLRVYFSINLKEVDFSNSDKFKNGFKCSNKPGTQLVPECLTNAKIFF
jgi:hypothetical protein